MRTKKHNLPVLLKQCFLINLAATVVAVAFNISSFGLKSFSLQEIVSSFVYSNCIGTLICFSILFFNDFWENNSTVIRLAKVSLAIFTATFFGVTIARLVLSLIFPNLARQGIIPSWQNFVFSLGIAFTFGFAFYFYEISQAKLTQTKEELSQKELAEEQAKTLATEAQLASLESRIHPHFLFNTLNSIASLIREEPIIAEKMVEKLSALLRYSLDSNAKGFVLLSQELEITQKYLEIEKVRFGDKLNYKIESSDNLREIKIPSLALQTLVENSIKHVASKTSQQTEIVVSVIENGEKVEIEVRDNGRGFSANEINNGHGLDNLQKRLQTLFNGEASLEIIDNSKGCVKLRIPKKDNFPKSFYVE